MKYKLGLSNFGRFFTVPCSAAESFGNAAEDCYYKILLFLLCSDSAIADSSQLAEKCGLSEEKINEAIKFWSDRNVIAAEQISAEEKQQAPAPQEYRPEEAKPAVKKPEVKKTRPKSSYLPVDIERKAKADPEIAQLLQEAQRILCRDIVHAEAVTLINFHEYYGYTVSTIVIMLEYFADIKKTRMAYLEKVIKDWSDKGIFEYRQVEEQLIHMTAQRDYCVQVSRILEYKCEPVEEDIKTFEKWNDWGFTLEMIDAACERCRKETRKIDVSYINGILKGWKAKNIRTIAEAEKADAEHKSKGYRKPEKSENTAPKKTSYDLEERRRFAASFNPNTVSFDNTEGI